MTSFEDTMPPSGSDWFARILVALLFTWILLLSAGVQAAGWAASQVALAVGDGLPRPILAALTLGQGVFVLIPAGLLAWRWRERRYRSVFRLWALAALFSCLLAAVHLPGPTQAYVAASLQIGLTLVYGGLLLLLGRRPTGEEAPTAPFSPLAVALAAGPLIALPWLAWGSLGSPLEALLNVASALLFGGVAALLLSRFWFPILHDTARSGHRQALDLFLGGFVAGAALLLMTTSFGYNGVQLLLALVVPGLSWIAMAISGRRGNLLPLTLLVGIAAAAPLLLVDPREMAIILPFDLISVAGRAFAAATLSLLIGWVLGAVLLLLRWQRRGQASGSTGARAVAGLLVVGAWGVALGVYALAGHPGFYGERLFVVLNEQADLASAEEIANGEARRRLVYETLTDHAESTQQDLRQALARVGIDYTPYYLVNGLEVRGGPVLRWWLERRPEVDRVLYNPTLRPLEPEMAGPASPSAPTSPPWNLERINAERVWEELGITGEGVVVGQSDSGVQWNHPELVDGYRGGEGSHDYNWFDPWYGTSAPTDWGGHGTHTLGTVLGEAVGVAPGATWFGCANLARNLGNTALYLDCMQFMLAPFPLGGDPFRDGDPAQGADVLNNSWGCPELEGCDADALLPAVRALRAAGIFVVVSAGNDGPACSSLDDPPAIYDEVFSVGAIDRSGALTMFSSRGPVNVDGSGRTKPDIVAPGQQILSAFPGNSYRSWQGTSMAGPHVTGVVALMWAANPALAGDIARTEEILAETAQSYTATTPSCSTGPSPPTNAYGYGIVDAYAAVQRAMEE
ncbi:MAG: S8 family serine peptidase [Candidatus Promineifilaceae bacterium]|nr:S8 family serine peptidase [Candidatus Promineifilaceae bacterium]